MATTPQQLIDAADAAFNCGDLNAVLSCYDEHAVWVVEPRKIVSGKLALRKAFEEVLRDEPQVIKEKEHIIECGDIALCSIKWHFADPASGGPTLGTGGFASTILRRGSDGHWRIVIDNPWGSSILESDEQGS